MKKKIYLASASPRRKELLKQLIGKNFEIIKSDYEEDNNLDMPPLELIYHHCLEKGKDVLKKIKTGIIISADTVGLLDGEILGKPHTKENAKKMLKKLSGKKIDVLTCFSVMDKETGIIIKNHERTVVYMDNYSDETIKQYVETSEPLDKAAAFAIQQKGSILVKKINGDYFNVVGFPLFKLSKALQKVGINVFEYK